MKVNVGINMSIRRILILVVMSSCLKQIDYGNFSRFMVL